MLSPAASYTYQNLQIILEPRIVLSVSRALVQYLIDRNVRRAVWPEVMKAVVQDQSGEWEGKAHLETNAV